MIEEKSHPIRNFFLLILVLLIATAVYFFIKWKPIWRDAELIEKYLDFQNISIHGSVDLTEEYYAGVNPEDINRLANLEGFSVEDLKHLKLLCVRDDRNLFLRVTPGLTNEAPLFDIYMNPNIQAINGAMIYNTIRNNVVGDNAVLDFLIPSWYDNEYVTFEQLTQLFDVDFSPYKSYIPESSFKGYDQATYFLLLLTMERDGQTYTKHLDGMDVTLSIEEFENYPTRIDIHAAADDPAKAFADIKSTADKFGMNLNIRDFDLNSLKGFDLTVDSSLQILDMPIDTIDQKIIDDLVVIKKYFITQ